MAKKESLYDKADKRLHKWAATIGAIIAIIGALTGALSWLQSQFTNAVSSQISDFQQETRDANNRHEQATTRIELMVLMEHDPTNVAAIEKLAYHYFVDLEGDTYLTGMYSTWCHEYGGDPSIAVGGRK